MLKNFKFLARFNKWTNEMIYEKCALLSEEEYKKNRKAFFESIHNTLNHLLVVDKLWLARMKDTKSEIKYLAQILYNNFDELKVARIEEDDCLIEFLDEFDEEKIGSSYSFTRMDGKGEFTLTYELSLITLFNHQTHHRGQVHNMLSQAGIKPSAMDVIDFPESKFYS